MESSQFNHSLLSDKAILHHLERGTVIIDPFIPEHLSTSSYDVTLGEYYFRESCIENYIADPSSNMQFRRNIRYYNPYSQDHIEKVWGKPLRANHPEVALENIDPGDKVIWLGPGETILAHTNEFIGGRESVTTMMKARSSMGRNFVEVCKCAGWGDVGFFGRWAMEITNNSRYHAIPLVVGRRIAQIIFFDTDGILDKDYAQTGKYQSSQDLSELKASWTPELLLPKMYKDRTMWILPENRRTITNLQEKLMTLIQVTKNLDYEQAFDLVKRYVTVHNAVYYGIRDYADITDIIVLDKGESHVIPDYSFPYHWHFVWYGGEEIELWNH
jgi:dCTP deaminase